MSYLYVCGEWGEGSPNELPVLVRHSPETGQHQASNLRCLSLGTSNIHVHVSVCPCVFFPLGYLPRSGIARSCCNSIFNHLRSCQTVFQSSWTIMHFFQQGVKVTISLHPFFFFYFIYFFLAVLGLRFCVKAFSRCGKWGPLFIAVRGSLTVVASPVAEHRLQTRRLSSCGSRA